MFLYYLSLSLTCLCDTRACACVGGGVTTRSRGYMVTRFCTPVVLSCYVIIPPHPSNTTPSDPSASSTYPVITIDSGAPTKFIPFPSHHCSYTRITSRCSSYSHSSRINSVVIYCITVLCIRVIYMYTYYILASLITYNRGG